MQRKPFAVAGATVHLAVSTDGEAVTSIELGRRATRPPAGSLERAVARELHEYLEGRRRRFTFAIRPQGTPFQRRVWHALETIPYGATRTYGDIARAVGAPGAARAVGQANHRNPIPLVIPCHRVVAAGGKLGGYGGGLAWKRRLLALEGERS